MNERHLWPRLCPDCGETLTSDNPSTCPTCTCPICGKKHTGPCDPRRLRALDKKYERATRDAQKSNIQMPRGGKLDWGLKMYKTGIPIESFSEWLERKHSAP